MSGAKLNVVFTQQNLWSSYKKHFMDRKRGQRTNRAAIFVLTRFVIFGIT
jgi:hypothetical protein